VKHSGTIQKEAGGREKKEKGKGRLAKGTKLSKIIAENLYGKGRNALPIFC
jgi:hypothetical protein